MVCLASLWKQLRQRRQHKPPEPYRRARIETLERRLTLTVSPEEQLFVYDLNRARHDPAGYQVAENLPIDLSGIAARPPLAVDQRLFDSAEFHATEMATHNYFGHQSAVTGDWPNQMARDAGFPLPARWSSDTNFIESLAAGTVYDTAKEPLRALIVDAGVPNAGHRMHLLGLSDFYLASNQIGVGHAQATNSVYGNYWAIHIAPEATAKVFLTGVVFNDANGNRRYDLNEGMAGVTITEGTRSVTTNRAGGWSLDVAAGSYSITASGGGFASATAAATVASANVEVDFIQGQPLGVLNFESLSTSPATNPRNSHDVNDDGLVTPIDALIVINLLNSEGALSAVSADLVARVGWVDPSGDGAVSAIDALRIINVLNTAGEGSGESIGFQSIFRADIKSSTGIRGLRGNSSLEALEPEGDAVAREPYC